MKILCFIGILVVVSTCIKEPAGITPQSYQFDIFTPEDQHMSSELLAQASRKAETMKYVHSLLVIRNGYIVQEQYYAGYNQYSTHNVMSVSKSFLSVIAGIAFEQGYLNNLDQSILDFFPEYNEFIIDDRKKNITIRHLLTMRMGIAGEAEENYRVYQSLYTSADWMKATFELPLIYDPGEKMSYNTFQTHLLSAIITKATRKSTLEYADEVLFSKMNISVDFWEQGPRGYYFGGNSMHFTPREMATLGLLYLNEGQLNGSQIVAKEWIDLSVTKTRAVDVKEWGVLKNYNYGYLWWLGEINNYKLYMALGYGGQTVLIFPEIELIVVTTAEEDIPPDVDQERPILELVANYILPAIK